jgi:LDH2 family malate/lactate/ureidoglycolate dehydrogenase
MQAADVLAAADLRGIDSHGVARMSSYVDLLGEANQSQTADQVGEVDAEHCDR